MGLWEKASEDDILGRYAVLPGLVPDEPAVALLPSAGAQDEPP